MTRRRPAAPRYLFAAVLLLAVSGAAALGQAPPAKSAAPQAAAPLPLTLPNKNGSLKFAVLGDFGTGKKEQYQLADVMARAQAQFPFEVVILVGDNLYGSERPQDFIKKFEQPYKALLDRGVKFYASLGNHDDVFEQQRYKLFNMEGKRYYTFKAPQQSVRFFALESTYLTPEQLKWLEEELKGAGEDWKIPYFHHPPYSSGERHGSDPQTREKLEPLFLAHKVQVVFTGHDHFYERVKPQKGIVYFVVGSGGQLRKGNIDASSPLTAKGFDTDLAFLIAEIDGDELHFNAVSRTGQIIDSGAVTRPK